MSYDRQWLESVGSEDAHAQSMWGLGVAVRYAPNPSVHHLAKILFHQALPALDSLTHSRPLAFCIVGLASYLHDYPDDPIVYGWLDQLSHKVWAFFHRHSSTEWPWFENHLTYSNAKLPHALICAGHFLNNQAILQDGLHALDWLFRIQVSQENTLSIIGNKHWYFKGAEKSDFDQQPVEAISLIDALAEAFAQTRDEKWRTHSHLCLGWFYGCNALNTPMPDLQTGGCSDGLEYESISYNQGAESTLSWLLSGLRLQEIERFTCP